jgi:mycoredoxin
VSGHTARAGSRDGRQSVDRFVLTMYSTTWCGYCRRLKIQLAAAAIEYAEVDVDLDEEAAEFVITANGGDRTVPLVAFPDGSTLTNPSLAQVQERLAAAA